MLFLRDLYWVHSCLTFTLNNLLGSIDNSSNVIMYSNDTSILISINCCEGRSRNFNKALDNTLRWLQASQLVRNMEKTKIVKFTPNFSYSPLHVTFAEHLPVETNAIKFLGLQLDNQLSWKPHLKSSCRKWFKKLEVLPRPSLYMFSLMLFVVDNLHYFKLIPLFTRLIQDIKIN